MPKRSIQESKPNNRIDEKAYKKKKKKKLGGSSLAGRQTKDMKTIMSPVGAENRMDWGNCTTVGKRGT